MLSAVASKANFRHALSMISTNIKGNRLILHPDKAAYWPAEKALLLSDLHLGKGAHFRRAGIAVPRAISGANFSRLLSLIKVFKPARVLFLGDLFHSDYNQIWPLFCEFTHEHAEVSFELIPGNHDILPEAAYREARMVRQPEILTIGDFSLSHHPLSDEERPAGTYNIYGHIHPCVRLLDSTGNSLRLPAFFFAEQGGILPAFGEFTGCAEVKARIGDRVFVVVEGEVIDTSA